MVKQSYKKLHSKNIYIVKYFVYLCFKHLFCSNWYYSCNNYQVLVLYDNENLVLQDIYKSKLPTIHFKTGELTVWLLKACYFAKNDPETVNSASLWY